MRVKTAVCVLVLAEGLSQETVWGQRKPQPAVRLEVAHARLSEPLPTEKPRPASPTNIAPSYILRTPAPEPAPDGLRIHRLLPLYTWEKTPFSSQVRVPVAGFWNGRMQLAGFHQRTRNINSNVPIPSRTRYGVGLWVRIDRSRAGETVPNTQRTSLNRPSLGRQ